MPLRDYQQSAIINLRDAFRRHRGVCLVMPCGAGKTQTFVEVARISKFPVLILVHRKELIEQASARLGDTPHGIIKAGYREAREHRIQLASVQTLSRRAKPPARLLILDEAHRCLADTWLRLLECYAPGTDLGGPDGAWILGCTATPYRLDGKGLGRVFGELVVGTTVRDLIEQGLLVEPRVLAPPPPDLSGVRVVGGDFDLEQLEEPMSKLTGDIVEHWKRHAFGRTTIVSATTIAHSRKIVQAFIDAGVAAEHIDGDTPEVDRSAALARLARRETLVLSQCAILTEGWDLPALEVAVLARPTASLCMHRQIVGRVMRACDGKNGALVLDHAGNHHRHGLVTEEVTLSLSDKVKRTGVAPLKTCPECFCVCSLQAEACPECGHVFEVQHREIREDDGELVEFKKPEMSDYYRALVAAANKHERRLGWARFRFKDKYGDWPSAARCLGRKANDVEAWYRCPSYEAKASQWGTKCGRCYRREDEHAKRREAL